jgi:three-Cys-motif partner protein
MKVDVIGPWSEIKLQILSEYNKAYSTILSKQRLEHVYIDAFAGSGIHVSRKTGQMVPGSPKNALLVNPPFRHHYFIDLDGSKVDSLRKQIGHRNDVTIEHGDCNQILLEKVFPNVRYEDYRRGLCFIDPYGLHVSWDVVQTAAQMKSIEILLNFPLYDMNLNVLWRRKPTGQDHSQVERMNVFWGDDTWRDVVYDATGDLFGYPEKVPDANKAIANSYRDRLKKIAGFRYVPEPVPMKNSVGSVVYFLFFATHNSTGNKIVKYVFDKYR